MSPVARPVSRPKRLATQIRELQSQGKYSFTRQDVVAPQRSGVAFEAAARRLKKQGRLATPRRGFFVIVPPEYSEAGCPPASWFVHDLMSFLGQPYYVALLSAAAIHGASHQQPMAFQVVTDRPTRTGKAGRVRIEFHMSTMVDHAPVVDVLTETGAMRVATPEVTGYDLVRFPEAGGHWNNVATVLGELAEKMDAAKLVELASKYTVPDVQRLGYLLDVIGRQDLAVPLLKALDQRRRRPVLLAPAEGSGTMAPDERWRVVPNVTVEADL
ncbi:MAG: type IV toxin-antitoxin system AbiEi family antitoxin [Polyangiaceae bacterium]|nr:type IV toxin-antitoxin system AbiEi family antitoxin [Polyangiaceae bacterium]